MRGDGRSELERQRASERSVRVAGPPWPEALAGAIVVGAGALIGAVVSWLLNRDPRQVRVRSEAPLREDRAAA